MALLLGAPPARAQSPAKSRVSEERRVEGWTVIVSRPLLDNQREQTEEALKLLSAQLKEIVRVVPGPAVKRLRRVRLWFSPEYPGIPPRAEFHPGSDWLREHGRNPAMVGGVEFTNVRIFAAETRRMPCFALHELAHAFHHLVLGDDNRELLAAYARAKASGKYERVERQDSEGRKTFDRAYALTNVQEYFAESTEAYFGRNDFYPFDRRDLEQADPEMCRLLARLWVTDPARPTAVLAVPPRAGGR
jgi:hypothetical protein